MTRPAFVGQPVLLLTHSTATGWRVYAARITAYDSSRNGPAHLEFVEPMLGRSTCIRGWFDHITERMKRLSFWVHLDERHLIEQHAEGQAWAADIADQLDRILGPKEPRQ